MNYFKAIRRATALDRGVVRTTADNDLSTVRIVDGEIETGDVARGVRRENDLKLNSPTKQPI